jgi:hypothetical protein
MKKSLNSWRNSSSVGIRKEHLQNVLSDTNEDEKAQTPTLSIEALRTIGDLVNAIKARINDADGHDQDDTATCAPLDSGSTGAAGPMGGEDPHSAKKEKR